MKYLHALLARDRENLQENPRALLLLTCKLAEHMLQTIILNTLPQSPRTGTGKSTKIIEKRFVTNSCIRLATYRRCGLGKFKSFKGIRDVLINWGTV